MLRKIPPIGVFVLWLTVLFGVTFFSDSIFYRSQKSSLDSYPNDLTEKKNQGKQRERLEPVPLTPKVIEKPKNIIKHVLVKKGDTLMKVLTSNGVDKKQAANLIAALKPIYDLRSLPIGHQLNIYFSTDSYNPNNKYNKVKRFSFLKNFKEQIFASRDAAGNFKSEIKNRLIKTKDVYIEGQISSSLYEAAVSQQIPLKLLMELIRIYSFDVDFQREIQRGDSFSILFKQHSNADGEIVHNDTIEWAELILSGKPVEYAKYTSPKNNYTDYYNREGKSVKKTLMRTPVDGARLSSRYGKRKHPILGFTKIHRGVDFAAPKGTPIMAAGDGVIEALGRKGNYGKYIRIRHNSTYKTAYGHLSRYKRGLKKGKRVKQGNIIGYVGSTGRSTGPHLHYEVIKNGKKTNPLSVRLPAGDALKDNELKTFLNQLTSIDNRIQKARAN